MERHGTLADILKRVYGCEEVLIGLILSSRNGLFPAPGADVSFGFHRVWAAYDSCFALFRPQEAFSYFNQWDFPKPLFVEHFLMMRNHSMALFLSAACRGSLVFLLHVSQHSSALFFKKHPAGRSIGRPHRRGYGSRVSLWADII